MSNWDNDLVWYSDISDTYTKYRYNRECTMPPFPQYYYSASVHFSLYPPSSNVTSVNTIIFWWNRYRRNRWLRYFLLGIYSRCIYESSTFISAYFTFWRIG